MLEASGGRIPSIGSAARASFDVILLAPIADELPPAAVAGLTAASQPGLVVLLIQGWLRRLEVGEAVHPLPLDRVDSAMWAAFGAADAVVVSTEDLTEAPGNPFAQAAELRARIGPRPLLVVTLGAEGYLLDDPAADHLVASMPRRVGSASAWKARSSRADSLSMYLTNESQECVSR